MDLKTSLNFDFHSRKSSLEKAHLTLTWIQKVFYKAKNLEYNYLIDLIKKQKINAISLDNWDDHICHNILCRVKKILREESNNDLLQGLLMNVPANTLSDMVEDDYKEKIYEALNELQIELENCIQALEHIHADETVMTLGRSETVENFLKQAGKTRKFHVIIAEAAPSFSGHLLAKNLTNCVENVKSQQDQNLNGITLSVIPDSAIFAVMSRVNKVLIGAKLTLANGGIQALSGTHNLAAAAKHFAVPVIVCAGMYKLTPTYLPPPNVYTPPFFCDYFESLELNSTTPDTNIPYLSGPPSLQKTDDILEFLNPVYDLVPPEFITVFISNTGSYSPTYVYQLMRELFVKEDFIDN